MSSCSDVERNILFLSNHRPAPLSGFDRDPEGHVPFSLGAAVYYLRSALFGSLSISKRNASADKADDTAG